MSSLSEGLEGRTLFASFTATSTADLIADINAANQTSAADTITLSPNATFSLTSVNNATSGATGLPVIKGTLTIVGNGRTIERKAVAPTPAGTSPIPVGGTPEFRLFDVPAGASLTLKNLTLQGGQATRGGAVQNLGTLNLQGVTVRNNAAMGRRGTTTYAGIGAGTDAMGGGIYSAGALVMTSCSLRNNTATGGMGVAGLTYGTDYSYFRAGPGGNGLGGALYIAGGTASVTGSTIEANTARGGSGGNGQDAARGRAGARGGNAFGGGLFAAGGVVTFRTTTIAANAAAGGIGGTSYRYDYATGTKVTVRAASGLGVGGASYVGGVNAVSQPASVRMDVFTMAHLTGNTASSGSPDLFGPHTVIA